MDPLSLCASILAIVTAAQSSVKGLRELKRCWKGPQEIDKLIDEIESLQATLHNVAAFIEGAKSTLYSESLSRPVDRAGTIIQSILRLFSSPSFHRKHLSNSNSARLTWLTHKNEIKALFDDLKVVRVDLSLKLGLVTA